MLFLEQEQTVADTAVALSLRCCLSDHPGRRSTSNPARSIGVCLLTGGDDRPYALGMASALVKHGVSVDFIGSNKLDAPELHQTPVLTFLNLRGDQNEAAPLRTKVLRILAYYMRLASIRCAIAGRESFISFGITSSNTLIALC